MVFDIDALSLSDAKVKALDLLNRHNAIVLSYPGLGLCCRELVRVFWCESRGVFVVYTSSFVPFNQ